MTIDIPRSVERAISRARLRTVRRLSSAGQEKQLTKTLALIAKEYGTGTLAPISLISDRHDVQCISSNLPPLDDILSGRTERVDDRRVWVKGSGRGFPRSRIIEIYGPESSGKTTLCLAIVSWFQQRGLIAAYIDAEHSLDMDYADRIGCETDLWLYSQGGASAEETLQMTNTLVKDKVVDLIVIDSVAALTPQAEIEGDVGDHHVGLHARLMSQALRKLSSQLTRNHRCTVIFVNQTRSKIGVRYGNPETTTGGNALKFYASQRIRMSSMGEMKGKGEKGIRAKIRLVKNKIAMPYGECFVDITGGNGITAAYSTDPRGKKSDGEDSDD